MLGDEPYIDMDKELVESSKFTAISSGNVSIMTKHIYQFVFDNFKVQSKPVNILDFGAGNGRNANWLKNTGISNVIAYDPFLHKSQLTTITDDFDSIKHKEWDIIFCSFVVNILPPLEREKMLKQLASLNYKYLFIESRTPQSLNDLINPLKYQDGFITKRGTFQKGFVPMDVGDLSNSIGYMGEVYFEERNTIAYKWEKIERNFYYLCPVCQNSKLEYEICVKCYSNNKK